MEYYRLILDFSHEELGDAFELLYERLSDAIIEVLDPHHPPDQPCQRDWYMRGGSVSAEYRLHAEAFMNEYVSRFKDKLKNTDSVDEFLHEASPHDGDE